MQKNNFYMWLTINLSVSLLISIAEAFLLSIPVAIVGFIVYWIVALILRRNYNSENL